MPEAFYNRAYDLRIDAGWIYLPCGCGWKFEFGESVLINLGVLNEVAKSHTEHLPPFGSADG